MSRGVTMALEVAPGAGSAELGRNALRRILDALGYEACDPDTLSMRCGLPPAELAALLTQLELDGRIATLPGGLIQRVQR